MKQVMPVLFWQLLVSLVLALVLTVVGTVAAYSALLGGLICVIPNAYLAGRLLMKSGRGDSRVFLRAAFVGETIKLVLTGSLFALVFINLKPLHAPALFAGFIAAQCVQWIGLIFIGRDRTDVVRGRDTDNGKRSA